MLSSSKLLASQPTPIDALILFEATSFYGLPYLGFIIEILEF